MPLACAAAILSKIDLQSCFFWRSNCRFWVTSRSNSLICGLLAKAGVPWP